MVAYFIIDNYLYVNRKISDMLTLNKAKILKWSTIHILTTRGIFPSTIIELSDTLIGTFAPYPNTIISLADVCNNPRSFLLPDIETR